MEGRLVATLLAWYDANARVLPWRGAADPYHVWVSEVMLQQTRVDTVIPYYERWIRRFPDVRSLAAAEPDEVLKAWEGLGYYRRARNLHGAARVVCDRHGGVLPSEPGELRRLPGVGDYTAGAVASIAFGVAAPAVDGNARRVLCRLFDVPDPGMAEVRALAAKLVPPERPGDFNQALMELGATICIPHLPDCAACPVAEACRARDRGTQAKRPAARGARVVSEYDVGSAVLQDPNGRLLLVRRPGDGLLAGLWEFPGDTIHPGESAEDAARRAALPWLDPRETRGPVVGTTLGTVAHAFTHRKVRYHAVLFQPPVALKDARAEDGEARWISRSGTAALAIPAAQRRILALVPRV